MRGSHILFAATILLTLSGCVSKSIKSTQVPPIQSPSAAIPEGQLLDVGIIVFDPGLEDYEDKEDEDRIYPEVRRAESLFLPNKLSQAIQESGAWGAVRVLPDENQSSDIIIEGEIIHSDGESLELDVIATDSRGVVWLDGTYETHASRYAYTMTAKTAQDPFQALFNTIANDLLEEMEGIPGKERRRIRLVTELLFAQSFSSDAFDGFLDRTRRGELVIQRLPAENDPMLLRVQKIRDRDNLFIDTLQGHYSNFDERMTEPYHEWRKQSYDEVIAIQELKAEATRNMIVGALAVIGGIAAQVEGDSSTSRAAGQVAMIGGAYMLKSGLYKRNEAQIHVEALAELGSSMETEIAPKVIELEDRTVTLTGNVEEQYAQWRNLLAEIYRAEVGDFPSQDELTDKPDTL
jgi:outer membrane lipoprotein SlyB